MANITYLLGAGASYNALPVVNELTNSINDVISILANIKNGDSDKHNPNILKDGVKKIDTAIEYLSFLRDGCKDHLSVDTFAKMLYLTGNDKDYKKAKNTMVLFFQLFSCLHDEIVYRNKPRLRREGLLKRMPDFLDKRYDAFLASILTEKYDLFPENIKVLSWNYDNQLEKSYLKYIKNANTDKTIDNLLNKYQKNDTYLTFDINSFGYYKINGSSQYRSSDQNGDFSIDDINLDKSTSIFWKTLQTFDMSINVPDIVRSDISFAWDSEEETQKLFGLISQAIKHTTHLVVIGYSFPYFNRKIDKKIFDSFAKGVNIIIQDPHANEIAELVPSLYPMRLKDNYGRPKILTVTNTNQFYLPNEL